MAGLNVNVIGVGYIGSLITLHLAKEDYNVVALDKDPAINSDSWFDRYNDIRDTKEQMDLQNITATDSYNDLEGEISIICVNTPTEEGSADIGNIKDAIGDLAERIDRGHTVIVRSTIPPGTSRSELIPLIEGVSDLEYGEGFHFCYGPEFVRGGTALKELENPSKTVIAGDEKGKRVFKEMMPNSENLHETSLDTAEAVKYFDNAFHGLKITMANECGRLSHEIGFDGARVMDIISSDYRLNVSDMYMQPGASFGGPCLEKDLEAIEAEARNSDTDIPLISSINRSNEKHTSWITEKVVDHNVERVGLVGANYKEDFESLENSPCLRTASQLEDEDVETHVYEPGADLEGFKQSGIEELRKTDLLVIFNRKEEVEKMREDFEGDIIDLNDFSF